VETTASCYERNSREDIDVIFGSCNSDRDDWIGIYPAYDPPYGTSYNWWGNSEAWIYLCGRQSRCNNRVSTGDVDFDNDFNVGTYKAYLFDNNGYRVKAASPAFRIGNCNPTDAPVSPTVAPVEPTDAPVDPTEAPTPVPTGRPTPVPTQNPTDSPTEDPTWTPTLVPTTSQGVCQDDPNFRRNNKNCANYLKKKREKKCNRSWQGKKVRDFCKETCGTCGPACTAEDDPNFRYQGKDCDDYLDKNWNSKCGKTRNGKKVHEWCPKTCGEKANIGECAN